VEKVPGVRQKKREVREGPQPGIAKIKVLNYSRGGHEGRDRGQCLNFHLKRIASPATGPPRKKGGGYLKELKKPYLKRKGGAKNGAH